MTNEELQKTKYCSFESQNAHWALGQERYIQNKFGYVSRDVKILDAACGDGVGLKVFKEMGFTNVTGIEFNPAKAIVASKYGYPVFTLNLSNLQEFDKEFDIIYSSHSLEHLAYPANTLQEFKRICKSYMLIVLPYPDLNNDEAHLGKFQLGTKVEDNGKTVCEFFEGRGFTILSKEFDSFREPEIWLKIETKN